MIEKILIANRGEIAVRIIRACREMGIETVAVYSEADKEALHTQLADEAVCIGPAQASESYLNMQNLISAALVSGADAIHPGFGFLSENAKFAELCEQCEITFIGPDSKVIGKMGNKTEARATMIAAGIPVIRGTNGAVLDLEEGKKEAARIGYPVIIKAALGGGGKGMRTAQSEEEFESCFVTARKEAEKAFGDGTMYIEHFVEHPRHIEFQILADSYGNIVHLGERDCSIQRNHQKMIEECPCAALSDELRKKTGRNGGKGRKGRRLYKRRNSRVSAGKRRYILFYGNEHKDTGGTSGNGVRNRDRSDQRADTDRKRRGTYFQAGRYQDDRSCDRMSDQCGDTGAQFYAVSRKNHRSASSGRKRDPCRYGCLQRMRGAALL